MMSRQQPPIVFVLVKQEREHVLRVRSPVSPSACIVSAYRRLMLNIAIRQISIRKYPFNIIGAMRTLRTIKKTGHLIKSVEADSRYIINHLYDDSDPQLEYTDYQWISDPPVHQSTVVAAPAPIQQPMKYLLPVLKLLRQGSTVNMCSFLLFNGDKFIVACKDVNLSLSQQKLEKSRLLYWVSHIFYLRMRGKLGESMVGGSTLDTVHCHEQKEYLPQVVPGRYKQEKRLVRRVKVSRDARYRRKENEQRQPFGVTYFLNGAQQLSTFTELVQFLEDVQNCKHTVLFKLLPERVDGQQVISKYSASMENKGKEWFKRLKHIQKQRHDWVQWGSKYEDEKMKLGQQKQYCKLGLLLTLQLVVFLEAKEPLKVQDITIEWTLDQNNVFYLSNVPYYQAKPVHQYRNPEKTIELYQKYKAKGNNRRSMTENIADDTHRKQSLSKSWIIRTEHRSRSLSSDMKHKFL